MSAPELLQGQDILILSSGEWSDNAVSNMQIPAALSATNKVIYVETMGGRWPRPSELGRVWARLKRMVQGTRPTKQRGLHPRNVLIYSPFAIPAHGNRFIDFLNTKLLLVQVRRLLHRMGMRRPLVWSFSPRWKPVADALDRCGLIFHCVDALHTYDGSAAFHAQFEQTVRDADVVFTPGVLLERELRALNPATFLIGHGCGAEHLNHVDDGTVPEDLRNVPEPRVVYAGTLANWVNYALLTETARRLPHVSFVLIGYVHALTPRTEVEKVLALPNVYHLGYKNFAELPRYYCRAAVGIVPYKINEHIRYSTPTKFLDYFAAGLPAVSTRFPAAEAIATMVECADTPAEFATAIENAIGQNSAELKKLARAYAREHTWNRQVSRMCARIREVLGPR